MDFSQYTIVDEIIETKTKKEPKAVKYEILCTSDDTTNTTSIKVVKLEEGITVAYINSASNSKVEKYISKFKKEYKSNKITKLCL